MTIRAECLDPTYREFCKCFGLQIVEIAEVSLSANQKKSEMKKLEWNIEGGRGSQQKVPRGGPVSNVDLKVEIAPMEIRTFLLEFGSLDLLRSK